MGLTIEQYSIGIGDRFGRQGHAQLRAVKRAEQEHGVIVAPVWNKSFREHSLIGTTPGDVRAEADDAVREVGWPWSYYVDADHVGMKTVESFVAVSNFFTLDVADFIGRPAADEAIASFLSDMATFRGPLRIPGVDAAFEVTDALLERVVGQYLFAMEEAGRVYRRIASARGSGNFVTEISVDEAAEPQSPVELFFILAAVARQHIPIQTLAPKFSGQFLKGIDYVGDLAAFAREFNADICLLRHASAVFGLPSQLKISVHTGSDKFSLYPVMHRALKEHGAGLHLKTAGTTWLEEIAGVALSGGKGFDIAKRVYTHALSRFEELRKPYATVVQIDRSRLPSPRDVDRWTAEQFVRRIRHDSSCPDFNVDMRQLMHIGFKVAAEFGEEFRAALDSAEGSVGRLVTDNLFERHIRPLFFGD
jgi:hypothetical protein